MIILSPAESDELAHGPSRHHHCSHSHDLVERRDRENLFVSPHSTRARSTGEVSTTACGELRQGSSSRRLQSSLLIMRRSTLLKGLLALCQLSAMTSGTVAFTGTEFQSERLQRVEFVREMERLEKETLRKKSQKSLQERLLKVAQEILPSSFSQTTERDLANNNYQNDDYLSNYVYANDASIDLAGYALKYVGCQNVHTWDDNLAGGDSTSPLSMKRFVTFRLCKANDCSAYNKWGCNFNFGEYVIPMEDYLAIMAEYHFEQFGRFCKTCYRCMSLDYYKDDDDAMAYNATDDGYDVNDDKAGCDLNDDGCSDDEYWAGERCGSIFPFFKVLEGADIF